MLKGHKELSYDVNFWKTKTLKSVLLACIFINKWALYSYFTRVLLICRDNFIQEYVQMAASMCFLLNLNLINGK